MLKGEKNISALLKADTRLLKKKKLISRATAHFNEMERWNGVCVLDGMKESRLISDPNISFSLFVIFFFLFLEGPGRWSGAAFEVFRLIIHSGMREDSKEKRSLLTFQKVSDVSASEPNAIAKGPNGLGVSASDQTCHSRAHFV